MIVTSAPFKLSRNFLFYGILVSMHETCLQSSTPPLSVDSHPQKNISEVICVEVW